MNTIPENGNFRMNSLEFVTGSNVIIMTTINNSITKGLFRTWISKDDGVSWTQIDEGSNVLFMDFINPTSGWGGQPQVLNGPSYMFKYTGNALTGLLDVHPLEAEVSIFPNPTSNAINLNIEGGASGEYQILLNDNQGKLVYKKVIRGSDHINHSIAADHLPSGLYTVNISDAKGSRSIKVVKL
ncbi:MAG: T9SS type A sorting domain-containing protein [Saprospiraceae bacterium]|nr:T9SS type A sorting domain-containing protein [Saprospiraceae bacterium]